MNNVAKSIMILSFLSGLGLIVWSTISKYKTMARNLIITPKWYGKLNDMKVDVNGIKLPLAVDLTNNSDASLENVRIDSLSIVGGNGQSLARLNKACVVNIKPYETTTIPVDVWITLATIAKLLGSSLSAILNKSKSSFFDGVKSILDGAVVQVTVSAFGLSVNIDVPIGESASVTDGQKSVSGLGMICLQDRKIKPLSDYENLLPPKSCLNHRDAIIKDDVTPEETAVFMRNMAKRYKEDTAKLATFLKGSDNRNTVGNIWNFVTSYIKYVPDGDENEQVRRPLRTLYDQKGDCDCYTMLIASICENLGLNYIIRIAEYANKGYFQHVYPIVEGMVCDPVYNECYKEKQPSSYKDF